ncbi:adenylyl-sulfate kinase [Pelagibacterales bacterium SAG-MED38]|nr:adenylyl-sulfate kinase [Pelagibacterales bacterium SAG-MED38]
MVILITGKSGAGKSFIASKLQKKIKNSVIVDGDEVRKHFTPYLGYTLKDRKKNQMFIQKLCKYLEDKGNTVICATISLFNEHQKKNRKIFDDYIQIYLKSDPDNLKLRSLNEVYKLKKNVVGKDISFPKPYKNDFIFHNNYDNSVDEFVKEIIKKVKKKIK